MDYGLIKTRIGWCGALLSDKGLRRVVIGAASRDRAASLLRVGYQDPVTSKGHTLVQGILRGLQRCLTGKSSDLQSLRLDMTECTTFERSVFRAVRRIPSGKTVRYKDIAKKIGNPKACRAVGSALARNPFPIVVPCHRVIGSQGDLCGFSAPGGVSLKRRLLSMEREGTKKGTFSSLS